MGDVSKVNKATFGIGVGVGRPAKGADRSPASWFDPGLYMGTGPGFPWVEAAAASGDGLRDKLLKHDPKNGVEDVCRLPNGVRVNGSVRSRGTLGGKRKKRSSATAVCRVYKKQSPNSRLTLYLSTREFVHATSRTTVSAIDGVVLVDPAYLKDRRVYAMVLLTFRYGREDEEVMGLKFFTEAILDFKQVYPEPSSTGSGAAISGVGARDGSGAADELTPLQQNLLKKLGGDAYPVTLRISSQAPPSVRLHPARPYQGSPLGVSYELKVFIGERSDEKPHKRNTVRMALRCVQYADFPVDGLSPTPPTASVRKTFFFCPGRLDLEAALDKETYNQGDMVRIHVTLSNGSSKTVQRLKVAVLQHVHVCMFTHGRFKNLIGSSDTGPSRPVPPGSTVSRDFDIKLQSCEKFPVALAIESEFHEEDSAVYSLSSTTVLVNPKEKNPYGVNVSYEVKVKAILGCIDRPLVVRLPFRVMLPRPPEGVRRPTLPSSKTSLKVEDSLDPITDCVSEDIARLGVSSSPHEVDEVS